MPGYNWNGNGGAVNMDPNAAMFGQVQMPQNMMGNQGFQTRNTQLIRPSYIPGKMINSLQDIVPQEVPMDGSAAVFPTSDLSCIYLNAWGSDGLIKTFKYIQDPTEQGQKSPEVQFQETILQRLDSIEELVRKRPSYQNHNYRKPYQNAGNNKSKTPSATTEGENHES